MFKQYRIAFRRERLSSIVRTTIRYVTLHFRDRHDPASLRYRNRAEITGSHVWTEVLSGMVYVPAQKLSLFAFVLFSSHFFKLHSLYEI